MYIGITLMWQVEVEKETDIIRQFHHMIMQHALVNCSD